MRDTVRPVHPEDLPRRRIPGALQHLVDEGLLGPSLLEWLFDRLPLCDRAIPMLGSAGGYDTILWSVERDAALAELAVRRLPASTLDDRPSLAADLHTARRVATEGIPAEDVHRALRPAAVGVGRLLAEALWRGVLTHEDLRAETLALTTLSPSGFPPNEVHAETRGTPRRHAGHEPRFVVPDVAAVIAGMGDDVRCAEIRGEIERSIAWQQRPTAEVLEGALARCVPLLQPSGEIAVLWVDLPDAHFATSGPRCQLLRARGGALEWLHRRRDATRSVEVHTIDAREGDTFVLLDDEAWAEAITHPRAEPPGEAMTPDALRRRYLERLMSAEPDALSPQGLALRKLGDLANALFAELRAPRAATAAILRVPPWRPPADLAARVARELGAFARAEDAAMALTAAQIRFRGDGHPPPGRVRHLVLQIGCDARLERVEAERLAERFVGAFRARHPWLCRSHEVEVSPLPCAPDASLQGRLDAVQAHVDEVLRGRVGLEARVRSVPSFGGSARIEVLILRDDVDGADDESAAAASLRARIRKVDRALARTVDIDSDYIK